MDDETNFDFKYVSQPELNKIIQRVQLAKKLQKEENFIDPRTTEFQDAFETAVRKKLENSQQMFKTNSYLVENSLLSHQNTIRNLLGIETKPLPVKPICKHQFLPPADTLEEDDFEITDAHHQRILNILQESREMLNNTTIEENFKEILNMSRNNSDFLNNVIKSGFVPVSQDPIGSSDNTSDTDVPVGNLVTISSETNASDQSRTPPELEQNALVVARLSDTSARDSSLSGMDQALDIYVSDSASSVADNDNDSVSFTFEKDDDLSSVNSKEARAICSSSVMNNLSLQPNNHMLSISDTKPLKKVVRESEMVSVRVPHDYFRKLDIVQHKITLALNEIRLELSYDITKPDGVDEKIRRRKRDSEFSSRFSRQYLYELSRKLPNLMKMMRIPNKTSQQYHVVCNKIIHLHSIILQGLQMYLRHIPDSLISGLQGRVKDLLKQYLAFDTICTDNHLSRDNSTMRKKIIRFIQKSRERVVQFRVRETESLQIFNSRATTSNHRSQICNTWSVTRKSESLNSVNKLHMYNSKITRPRTPFAKKRAKVKLDLMKKKGNSDQNSLGQCIIDPDIDTLMDKFGKEQVEIQTISTTKSAPELADEKKQVISYHKSSVHPHKKSEKDNFDEIVNGKVESTQSSDVLRKAIKYKKKLQKLMKSNPMIQKEDKAWDMVSKVVCQLMNESIIDITTSLSYQHSKTHRNNL